MKGLYQLKQDPYYTEKMLSAGIDTLIIPFYDIPGRPGSGGLLNTWDENVAICEMFKNKAKIVATPVTLPHWCDVPEEQRFIMGGKPLPRHFCPSNAKHLESQIAPFRHLFNLGLIHEVIWDNEHYSGEPLFFRDKNLQCGCANCSSLGWEGVWNYRASVMQREPFITGQMPYNTLWSMRYTNSQLLTAETYNDSGFWDRISNRFSLWWARRKGNYTVVPGAWLEIFHTDDFIKYLKYLKSKYGGYWIYSQTALTKNLTFSQADMDTAAANEGYFESLKMDEVDPDFFDKLKSIN